MKIRNICELFAQAQRLIDLKIAIRVNVSEKGAYLELPLEAVMLWGMKELFLQNDQGEQVLRVLTFKEAVALYRQDEDFIRIIDSLDNDFLVFDHQRRKYSLFNAGDNIFFKDYETLLEFLRQNSGA